jgi:hypothetical protein
MTEVIKDNLKPAVVNILNCFRERGLREGGFVRFAEFGDAIIWERGFVREEDVRQAWAYLTSNDYVIEFDNALQLTKRGEQYLYGKDTATEKVTSMPEPTYEELKARLAELESKQPRAAVLSFKVGDKGGVSVYGLGRFPVTLYYEQWVRLLDKVPELREFLEANKSKLKLKE